MLDGAGKLSVASNCQATFNLSKLMHPYLKYTLIFLAGVVLSARVRALPVIGPMIPTL